MRRAPSELRTLALGVLVALVLSACGGDGDGRDSPAATVQVGTLTGFRVFGTVTIGSPLPLELTVKTETGTVKATVPKELGLTLNDIISHRGGKVRIKRSGDGWVFVGFVGSKSPPAAPAPPTPRRMPSSRAAARVFQGVWKSVDLDGSKQKVRFAGTGTRLTATLRDSFASPPNCRRKSAVTAEGSGVIEGSTLSITWTSVRCTETGEVLQGVPDTSFRWRQRVRIRNGVASATPDTIKDNNGIVWKRG